MKKTALLSLLLFTFIGCSESFDVDLSFGEKESIRVSGETRELSESLLLFGRRNSSQDKETKI